MPTGKKSTFFCVALNWTARNHSVGTVQCRIGQIMYIYIPMAAAYYLRFFFFNFIYLLWYVTSVVYFTPVLRLHNLWAENITENFEHQNQFTDTGCRQVYANSEQRAVNCNNRRICRFYSSILWHDILFSRELILLRSNWSKVTHWKNK